VSLQRQMTLGVANAFLKNPKTIYTDLLRYRHQPLPGL
jgi:hypothetical protein